MPEEKRPLKVFLSHAHSDAVAVRALYERLTADEVDAWLDKEKLLPGQDWELEISDAVREADVIVVCLSKEFNQAGYRQKEVRWALDTAMEKPEGEIFIIPARLEECENLRSLSKWQWVDLFEADGYEKLIKALTVRAQRLGCVIPSESTTEPVEIIPPPSTSNLTILPESFLAFESEPGDYIGEGQSMKFTPSDYDFMIDQDQPDELMFSLEDGRTSWEISFAAPRGEVLESGHYEGAERTPFKRHRSPGFEFSGDGRGCDELQAEFDILKLERDSNGNLTILEANFIQRCVGGEAAMRGQFRFYAQAE